MIQAYPEAEQALYPADYGADLQDKIDRDFNYFTHTAGGQPGVTSAIEGFFVRYVASMWSISSSRLA